MFKRKYDKYLLYTILVSFIISIISIGLFMIKNKGIFLLGLDFKNQQVVMDMAINNIIRNGFPLWSWNCGLGTQTIGAYSFYADFPFSYISFIFPSHIIPYLIGWFYIFRFVLTSVFSYLYINSNCENSKYSLIGAILYSFSGYVMVNLIFHFFDFIMLFPLLLFSFDRMIIKNKKLLYIFLIAACSISNYYLFISEALFIVLYYFFRFFKSFRASYKEIFRCIYTSLIGLMMSSILFIPSIMHSMNNSRMKFDINNILTGFGFRPFLNTLKGMFLPAEPMGFQSSVWNTAFDSCGLYLPFVGMAMAGAYVLFKKKDWLKNLILFLAISSYIPLIYMAFCGYTDKYYRWWFSLVLMLCLATTRALEDMDREKNYPLLKGVMINIIPVIVFLILLFMFNKFFFNGQIIMDPFMLIFEVILLFLGLLFLILLCKKIVNQKRKYLYFVSMVALYSVITLTVMCWQYSTRDDRVEFDEFVEYLELGKVLKQYDDSYRYRTADNILIMTGEINGSGVFSSTISSSVRDFESYFDYYYPQFNLNFANVDGLNELMASKYDIVKEDEYIEGKIIDNIETRYGKYYIVDRPASPIGFAYDTYITPDQLINYSTDERGLVLLTNICVKQSEIKDNISIEQCDMSKEYQEEDIDVITQRNIDNSVKSFKRMKNGFVCETDYLEDKLVWFSVPFDKGWKVFIDGKEENIIQSVGMMAVAVETGNHLIEFKYNTPGLKSGFILSIIGTLIFMTIVVIEKKDKRNVS